MLSFKRAFCALPLAAALFATPADAAIHYIDFEVMTERLQIGNGDDLPFGLTPGDPVTGQVIVDDQQVTGLRMLDNVLYDNLKVIGLNFAPGNKTWSLSDIQYSNSVIFEGGSLKYLYLDFGPPGSGYGNGLRIVPISTSFNFGDSTEVAYCSGCVTWTDTVGGQVIAYGGPGVDFSVPEPGTWALMITGFGLVGASLRRSRRIAI